jgi:hypothetical protein
MKYLLAGVTVLFSLITGFMLPNNDINISVEERLVDEILFSTGEYLEKIYQIKTVGEGAEMPGGHIQKLSLIFETKKIYLKNSLESF